MISTKDGERAKKWREANPEKAKQCRHESYLRHKEKRNAESRVYYRLHAREIARRARLAKLSKFAANYKAYLRSRDHSAKSNPLVIRNKDER